MPKDKIKMNKNKGFTLIELLVVISIIGLLASVLLVAVTKTRAKARDAKKMTDLKQISTAINLYYQTYGKMPNNYNCWNWSTNSPQLCVPDGQGNTVGTSGSCDAVVPGMPGADPDLGTINNLNTQAYINTMQQLVTAGILSAIPRSHGGPGYCYFDFGKGNNGAILMSKLEAAPLSITGLAPSCRPWTSIGATWCEQRSSLEFCMCNSY